MLRAQSFTRPCCFAVNFRRTQISMRLLTRDDSGRIYVTNDLAEKRLPPYAVLSHTWSRQAEEEVTLQDIKDGTAAGKPGYAKIEFCLSQAERDGMSHCWIDTCCIDKTNHCELNESIVSMFRWYQNARKCYVYLSDVPLVDFTSSNSDERSDFRGRRWFQRGWTLQELLAPRDVVFYDSKLRKLGTKQSLTAEISIATGIPAGVLQGTSFTDFPEAERFAWQEKRKTTKPEDLVYSLLGLFEVSMPIIYGEGYVKARQRLEEEISKAARGVRHHDFTVSPCLNDVPQVQDFVGRTQELNTIVQALSGDGSRRYVTVHGLGGMGKTQLALRYATRYKHMYSAIFWLNIDSKDTIAKSFVKTANHILSQLGSSSGINNSGKDVNVIFETVKNWLGQPHNKRWLMIFDNYDDPKVAGNVSTSQVDIQDFLPIAHQGAVIITTRSAQVKLGQTLHLKKFTQRHESMTLLSTSSRRVNLAQGKDSDTFAWTFLMSSIDPYSEQLVDELDGLPLALATAGAYLSQSSMSLERYLELYRTSWADLQKMSSQLYAYEDRKLFSTWQITFEHIKKTSPPAANLLRLFAYFGNEDIWLELLQHYNDDHPLWISDLVGSELRFEAAVQLLHSHGLVEEAVFMTSQHESRGYSMHKCVHLWTQSVLESHRDPKLVAYALCCIGAHIPLDTAQEYWVMERRLLCHVSTCIRNFTECDNGSPSDVSWVWHNLGLLHGRQSKLKDSETMFQRALSMRETALGVEHTSTLDTVHYLGTLYRAQSRVSEAEAMYLRALAGREKALGHMHTSTLHTVNNLAQIYHVQGKYAEAEEMFRRALAGREKMLGPKHTLTLDTLNAFGQLLCDQDKITDAETMFMRALAGRKNSPDITLEHTSVCLTFHSLGELYFKQGRLYEANAMYMRAHTGLQNALGAEHVWTLYIVESLGMLSFKQDKLAEAESLYNKALAGSEKAVGVDNVLTFSLVHKLGLLYGKQGKLRKAETMYQRALLGREKRLGPTHRLTLDIIHDLGNLYAQQGKLAEAKAMYKRALEGYRLVQATATDADKIRVLEDVLSPCVSTEQTGAASGFQRSSGGTHQERLVY